MPVERFTEDESNEQAPGGDATSAVDPNTSAGRGWLRRLVLPTSAGAVLGIGLLACFLLTGVFGRSGAGVSERNSTLVSLEEQTINLAEPGTRLEVRIVFEASSPEFAAKLRWRSVQLADTAISVINTKTLGQLDTELERNRLKRELADAVGQRVRSDEAHIANVYFTRFYYE